MKFFLLLVGGLFTVTYFIRVINDDEINMKYGIFGALISGGYIASAIYSIMSILVNVPWLDKYSLILTYLLTHILIFSILFFLIAYFSIGIYQLYSYSNVRRNLKCLNSFNAIILKCSKTKEFLGQVNKYFNPLNKFKNKHKFNISKFIKLIMLISYLISGVFLLSYLTNIIELNGIDFEVPAFKRDYELYKTVFVTSLIPFTINYIKDFNKP